MRENRKWNLVEDDQKYITFSIIDACQLLAGVVAAIAGFFAIMIMSAAF